MKRNVTLWVIQGLLAALFLFAGFGLACSIPEPALAGKVLWGFLVTDRCVARNHQRALR